MVNEMDKIFLQILNLSNKIDTFEKKIKCEQQDLIDMRVDMEDFTDAIAVKMKEKGLRNYKLTDSNGDYFMFYQQDGKLKYMKI